MISIVADAISLDKLIVFYVIFRDLDSVVEAIDEMLVFQYVWLCTVGF